MKLQYDKKEIDQIKKDHPNTILKLYKYTFQERESGQQQEVQFVMKEPSEVSVDAWIELTTAGSGVSATREYLADNTLGRDRKDVLEFLTKYIGVAGAISKKYSTDFQGVSNREAESQNL